MLQSGATETTAKDGLKAPAHVEKKLTKKVQFLRKVADSKQSALAATAGVHKNPHKRKDKRKDKRKKALPDLSSLADILAEVGQQPSQQQQQQSQQQQESKQQNKQKGRTEQISSSKARRVVTYVSLLHHTASLQHRCLGTLYIDVVPHLQS